MFTTGTTIANAIQIPRKMPIVCLCMIVRNESKIIERCLDSTLSLIDCLAISDTGSTDNTVEIIKAWQARNNVPGDVYSNPFQNFAHNRTLSLENTRTTLQKLGHDLNQSYALLIDADMMLVANERDCPEDFCRGSPLCPRPCCCNGSTNDSNTSDNTKNMNTSNDDDDEPRLPVFKKDLLEHDQIYFRQLAPGLDYKNVRMLRQNIEWKCVSKTHEYYCTKEANVHYTSNDKFYTFYIDDRNDGGCKADKFTRDERLLREQLQEEPKSSGLYVRALFYLGETLKNLGGQCKSDAESAEYKAKVLQEEVEQKLIPQLKEISKMVEDIEQKLSVVEPGKKEASSSTKVKALKDDHNTPTYDDEESSSSSDSDSEDKDDDDKEERQAARSLMVQMKLLKLEEQRMVERLIAKKLKQCSTLLMDAEMKWVECKLKWKEAIQFYEERARENQFDEEIWFAKYMRACLLLDLHNREETEFKSISNSRSNNNRDYPWCLVLEAFSQAYQYRAHRAEPLNKLADHYRSKGENATSCMYALAGSMLDYPDQDILFIDTDVYNYKLIEHISICGFYLQGRYRELGEIYCNRLVLRSVAPEWLRTQVAVRNQWYYAQPLQPNLMLDSFSTNATTSEHNLEQNQGCTIRLNPFTPIAEEWTERTKLTFKAAEPIIPLQLRECKWRLKNASIVPYRKGYLQLISAVNYVITDKGGYAEYGPYVYSRNFLVYWNDRLTEVERFVEIQDCTGRKLHSHNIQGLEDCRLIQFYPYEENPDAIYFTCTTLDTNCNGFDDTGNRWGIPEMSLGCVTSDGKLTLLQPLAKLIPTALRSGDDNSDVAEVDNNKNKKIAAKDNSNETKQDDEEKDTIEAAKNVAKLPPKEVRAEKNWLPFYFPRPNRDPVAEPIESIECIYSQEPHVLLQIPLTKAQETHFLLDEELVDEQTAANALLNNANNDPNEYRPWQCRMILNRKSDDGITLDQLRGSAGPFYWSEDEFLLLTHEVAVIDGKRKYLHRFVVVSSHYFEPVQYSLAFAFHDKNRIEYVAGGCWSHEVLSRKEEKKERSSPKEDVDKEDNEKQPTTADAAESSTHPPAALDYVDPELILCLSINDTTSYFVRLTRDFIEERLLDINTVATNVAL
jgi:glycosyltransferase involved in cell wall biosynthesis